MPNDWLLTRATRGQHAKQSQRDMERDRRGSTPSGLKRPDKLAFSIPDKHNDCITNAYQ